VYGNTTSKYEYYPDYDFREDACYYKIIPNTNNVELMMYGRFNNRDGGIYAPDSCYIIPETVKYNGQTYYITIIGKLSFSFLWKNLTKITIPSSVTEIKEYAFMDCTKLQEIVIPDNVSSIGRGAFIGCAQLCKITIPDKINKIEDYTFQNCKSLTDFSIGNNIKIIGDKAFAQSGLTSIVIPDGTDSIKESAFENCQHLKSAVISQSVRYIGKNAFYSGINVEGSELTFIKGNLSAINVEEDNGVYSSENGVLFNKDKTVLIKYPPKNELSMQYKIPLSVKKIEEYAFVAAILDSVFIPKSVNDIGKYAFSHSNICSITIPDSIKDIKSSTFSGCKNLSVVVLPKGIKEIQDGAFANCINLKSLLSAKNSIKNKRAG
jgi:lactocepin